MNRAVSIFEIPVSKLKSPLYKSIASAIADMIEARTIVAGSFLPSRRALADSLGVSVQTVREAYEELDQRGYVSGEVGRGTRVLERPDGAEWNSILERRDETMRDLSILRPVFGPKHAAALEQTLADMARAKDFRVFSAYRPSVGFASHRKALSAWLARLGVAAGPDELLVTNGATHAGFIALSSLCQEGDVVLTTELTDVGLIGMCRNLGVDLRGIAFDGDGPDPSALDAACARHKPKALILTPSLANPAPFVTPEGRRREIAKICAARDVMIIEDDCFSPLLTDAPPPMRALCPERTVYYTTFSKVLMSGMRVGCLAAPPGLRERFAARLRGTTWMAAPMLADVAARWIDDGTADALVAWQRGELAARQRILRAHLPAERLMAPEVGLNGWLQLPSGWNVENFVAAARQRDVAITSPEAFRVDGAEQPRAVRLCVGPARTLEELTAAAEILAALLPRPEDFLADYA